MKSLSENPLRAAALVLHSLSANQADRLKAQLPPGDRFKLDAAVAQLAAVTSEELLDALERLAREAERDLLNEAARDPISEIARPFLPGPVADEDENPAATSRRGLARPAMENSSGSQPSPLAFLHQLETGPLASLIIDEHPEDIALVLVDLPADLAAELLQRFDPILRFSVLRRMCRLEKPNEHRAEELAFQLKLRLHRQQGHPSRRDERGGQGKGLAAAARVVSLVPPKERQELLQQLRLVDRELESEVAQQVFEFEQLADLTDEQIRLLLKRANTAWWAPALVSATPAVRERILGCLAKNVAAIVKREMKALGEISSQVAQRARQEIVATWLRLND